MTNVKTLHLFKPSLSIYPYVYSFNNTIHTFTIYVQISITNFAITLVKLNFFQIEWFQFSYLSDLATAPAETSAQAREAFNFTKMRSCKHTKLDDDISINIKWSKRGM